MANARKGNVLRIDTSAAFTDVRDIKAIKYKGAASGTAEVRADASASGTVLWEESGTSNVFNEVCLQDQSGLYFAVTNNAILYVYLK